MQRASVMCGVTVVVALLGGWAVGLAGQTVGQTGQSATTRDSTAQQTQQSQTPPPTGEINGQLTVEGAGTPLRHAQVVLTSQQIRGQRTTVTDEKGLFSFLALPAGHYSLSANKAAYVAMTFGAKKPGHAGVPIELAEGQKFDRASFSLPKGSVVTGVVIDENGEASPGTQVRVLQFVTRTGERALQQAGTATTDDRGMYRIYGLQPGDYIVSATPRSLNAADLRQSVQAQIDQLMQQAQAYGTADPSSTAGRGGAGGRGGGIGGGGRATTPTPGGGRGQQYLDQATALQQQLAVQEKQQTVGYAPVYYPGTTAASSAVTVSLGISEERGAIDFQLQLVQTAIVSGVVISPDGHLPQGTQVTLMPANPQGTPAVPGVMTNTARIGGDGRFTFANVMPGQYTIGARGIVRQVDPTQAGQAAANQPGAQRGGGRGAFGGPGGRGGNNGIITQVLWASADIAVAGQNLADLTLNLQPGMTVSGHVDFHGTSLPPPPDLTRVRVTISPQDTQSVDVAGALPPAQCDAAGNFTLPGVPPGRYILRGSAPVSGNTTTGGATGRGATITPNLSGASWSLKSSIVDGRDSLDFPFEIKPNSNISGVTIQFVDQTQTLKGTLSDSTGRPTSDYTIIVFASDQAFWTPQSRRIASTRPSTDGTYQVRGLPSGDYRMIAVTDVDQGEWFDPAFLSQYVNASIPISLSDGQTKTQDLKLAGGGG